MMQETNTESEEYDRENKSRNPRIVWAIILGMAFVGIGLIAYGLHASSHVDNGESDDSHSFSFGGNQCCDDMSPNDCTDKGGVCCDGYSLAFHVDMSRAVCFGHCMPCMQEGGDPYSSCEDFTVCPDHKDQCKSTCCAGLIERTQPDGKILCQP
eukprot:TRINITY_DN46522_c0_g1_i1.p1 TRINITY_DN46522_c0_g1~~TRINITY_DN46522_c0_g1_i1.p1  ORF type:complete len:154 (+),score=21.08 TRINITY_DN46522_c0_g1_i1:98-559(+)